MATRLLILGKGDNVITMILDNLYSHGIRQPDIHVYNNLGLPTVNTFEHDRFDIEVLTDLNTEDYDLMALGVYQPSYKRKIVEALKPDPNKFMNVIHTGLDISYTSKLGRGLLINSKVSIAAHTVIGDFVSINRHVSIGHHTTIGDYCSINPGVNIAGNVVIGEGSTIGMGTNVLQQVKIGKNTIIGAGSVVTRDIPDNVIAYGSPCKIIKQNG
jgi:UDP-N-acetylbacillosamine N-acetyltransferase